ncbi:MAG TPA: cyclic nucleotide-binding domain-containing protein [bacterium]|nr:cyclic nucleotide-binding domain-containing protein [bacterium]
MNHLQYGTKISIKNKTVIYPQNSVIPPTNNCIYFIIKGKVAIAKKIENNNYFRFGLGENMLFGAADCEYGKRITNAIAIDDCELYGWTFENFIMNIQVSITLARMVTYSLCKELRYLNEKKEQNFFNEKTLNDLENIAVSEDTESQSSLCNLAFNSNVKDLDKSIMEKFGKTFKKNEILIAENDMSNDFYIICKGETEIIKNNKIIAKINEGEIVGEMSYFDSMPRTATVRAATDVSVLVLTPENFNVLYQLHPEWSVKIVKSMKKRVFEAYKNLV